NVADERRTALFARYSLVGSLIGALGALCAALPELISAALGVDLTTALQAMFLLYALIGGGALLLYRELPPGTSAAAPKAPLGPSRRIVLTLGALFSLDSFGSGFFVQSLLALWLFEHFGLSLAVTASFFFWTGVLSALSFLAAVRIAGR